MSITDRARAEAADAYAETACYQDENKPIAHSAFIAGAEWHASLPPTDEEVEAASRGFYEGIDGLTNWDSLVRTSPDIADRYRVGIRRALIAAREAQQ